MTTFHPAFRALGSAVLAFGLLTACGGGGEAARRAPPNPIATGRAPSHYPAEYAQLIETSRKEGGTLTLYSNTDQENRAPIFRDFQKKYPWVTKMAAGNLDSDEVFQRVLSEQASGGSPADLIVSKAAQARRRGRAHRREPAGPDPARPRTARRGVRTIVGEGRVGCVVAGRAGWCSSPVVRSTSCRVRSGGRRGHSGVRGTSRPRLKASVTAAARSLTPSLA